MDNKVQPQPGSSLRLPPFWAENTEAWFAIPRGRLLLLVVPAWTQVPPSSSSCSVAV